MLMDSEIKIELSNNILDNQMSLQSIPVISFSKSDPPPLVWLSKRQDKNKLSNHESTSTVVFNKGENEDLNDSPNANSAWKFPKCNFQSPLEFLRQQTKIVHTLINVPIEDDNNIQHNVSNTIQNTENGKKVSKKNMKDNLIESTTSQQFRRYQCDVCQCHFSHIRDLEIHMEQHPTVKAEEVTDEGVTKFTSPQVIFQRDKYSYCTDSKNDMEFHQTSHLKPVDVKPFLCNFCGLPFVHEQDLNKHCLLDHEDKAAKTYRCSEYPDDSLFLESSLPHHKNNHDYICCPNCSFSCHNMKILSRHVSRCHKLEESKRVIRRRPPRMTRKKCPLCVYVSCNRKYFITHLRKHNLGKKEIQIQLNNREEKPNLKKPYKCSWCLFATNNQNNFTRHLEQHQYQLDMSKIKNQYVYVKADNYFQCKKCNFKTKYMYFLSTHLKRHVKSTSGITGYFYCNQCNFQTNYKEYLEFHMQKHNVQVTIKEEFPSLDNQTLLTSQEEPAELLEIQKEKANGEKSDLKPFRCKDCTFETRFEEYLTLHMSKHLTLLQTENSTIKEHYDNDAEAEFKCNEENCRLSNFNKSMSIHVEKHKELTNMDSTPSIIKPKLENEEENIELETMKYEEIDFTSNIELSKEEQSQLSTEDLSETQYQQQEAYSSVLLSRFEKYFDLHMSKHHMESEMSDEPTPVIILQQSKNSETTEINKPHCAFKCNKHDCNFITNFSEYWQLHQDNHKSTELAERKLDAINSAINEVTANPVHEEENLKLNESYENEGDVLILQSSTVPNESPASVELHDNKVSNLNTHESLEAFQNEVKTEIIFFKSEPCDFEECLDLHMSKPIESVKTEVSVGDDSDPDVILEKNIYEDTKNSVEFKCDEKNCHFTTRFQNYWELHKEKHTVKQEAGNIDPVDNEPISGYEAVIQETTEFDEIDNIEQDAIQNLKKLTKYYDEVLLDNGYLEFKCKWKNCDFKTGFKHYLKLHLLRHKNEQVPSKETPAEVGDEQEQSIMRLNMVLETFKCQYCLYRTKYKDYMDDHMKIHMQLEEPDNDDHFNALFYNAGNISQEYSVQKEFLCKMCDFSTNFEDYLGLHLLKHNNIKQQSIESEIQGIDQEKSANSSGYCSNYNNHSDRTFCEKQHETVSSSSVKNGEFITSDITKNGVTSKSRPNSQTCNDSLILTASLDENVSYYEVINLTCEDQETKHQSDNHPKNITVIEAAQNQKSSPRLEKQFKCEICDFSSNFKDYLDLHVLKHKNTEQRQSKEELRCLKSSDDEINKAEQLDRPFKCEKCTFTTHFRKFFVGHLKKHSTADAEGKQNHLVVKRKVSRRKLVCPTDISKYYLCRKCDFMCLANQHFWITRHKAKHEFERIQWHKKLLKKYTCSKCIFTTFSLKSLEIHQLKYDRKKILRKTKPTRTLTKYKRNNSAPQENQQLIPMASKNESDYVANDGEIELKLTVEEIEEIIENGDC